MTTRGELGGDPGFRQTEGAAGGERCVKSGL
jgi:hypothetical protein